jgi:copper resistance protein B
MVLYDLETQATAYLGEGGQTALRLKGDYDILLTNRLILQPTAEMNLYGKNDPKRNTGSGLSDTDIGLRLRYEIRREFAPYIGVTWNRSYGKTADYAREEGEDRSETRLVLGVRMWF